MVWSRLSHQACSPLTEGQGSRGNQWLQYQGGGVDLTAGEHTITIRHTFTQGPRVLEIYWTPPGGQREIIPAWVLSPP